MSEQNEIPKAETALTAEQKNEILVTPMGIDFANFDGLWRIAVIIHRSGFFPKGLQTTEAIAVCIARGRAIGLDPFQAMDSIGVINGKPVIYGDAPLAVCRQHPSWDESGFEEEITGKDDSMVATCKTLRKGGKQRVQTFSVQDAKNANLWSKDGPWKLYPKRMLMFRARGYNLRDNFGDALKGISVAELTDEETQQEPPVGQFSLRNGSGPKVETGTADTVTMPKEAEPEKSPEKPRHVSMCSKTSAQAIRDLVKQQYPNDLGASSRIMKPFGKHSFDELTESEAQDVLAELRGAPETANARDW